MLSVIYNFLLFKLGLFLLPKWLWQCLVHRKYRKSFKARFFPDISVQASKRLVWIHAVSMGETRAAEVLYRQIKKHHPDIDIAISSITETGHEEAKRLMPDAKAHFFLPLDFSWNMKRLFKQLQPACVICMESDFWYQLLQTAKQKQVPVVLMNGKISERSFQRFKKLPFFSKPLFSSFNLMSVQSEEYRERFEQLGVSPERLHVTGNLKLSAEAVKLGKIELEALRSKFKITQQDLVIVLGSTHDKEEELLLSAIKPILSEMPTLKILVIPRHPERFSQVAVFLKKLNLSNIILVDEMGLLNSCYQIADVAIVGGSFVDGIGGHNVFEPVSYEKPVLFGPFMHNQRDLAKLILSNGAGAQVAAQELSSVLRQWLFNQNAREQVMTNCQRLIEQVKGTSAKAFELIAPYL